MEDEQHVPAMRKWYFGTMNALLFFTTAVGLVLTNVAFKCYQIFQFPNVTDDHEAITMISVVLTAFGLITVFLTTASTFQLNKGTLRFKIMFCGLSAFVAISLLGLRNCIPETERFIDKSLRNDMRRYFSHSPGRSSVDDLQKHYKCCGYYGPADYQGELPVSCCSVIYEYKQWKCTLEDAYKEACNAKVIRTMNYYFDWLRILCFVMANTMISLILMLLAIVLVFRNGYPREEI